ncbi:MAG: hypothetical protein K2L07_14285 [Lachnospiraceae bacterium]|nr:hypothetical protein [Lachnospiraceae bacterium]
MMKWKKFREVIFLAILIAAGFYFCEATRQVQACSYLAAAARGKSPAFCCERFDLKGKGGLAAEFKQQENTFATEMTDQGSYKTGEGNEVPEEGEAVKDKEDDVGVADSASMTVFCIDNKNLYADMDKTYSKGYVPKVKKGKAVIVLPLLAKAKLKGDQVKSSLNLGEAENIPFVQKNYEKDVSLKKHKIGNKGMEQECYLISYTLDLKKNRYNGSYPVIITVTAQDEQGNEVHQDFTVYVTITDGSDMDTAADTQTDETENPQFAPKVIVDSYTFSKDTIQSGDSFMVKITLRNTSKKDMVKNMLVTAAPAEQVELISKSDSVYVEELQTQKTCEVTYEFRIHSATPQGQYSVPLTLDYADSKGNSYTGQGTVKIMVELPVKIEIDPIVVPKEIQMGETIELQTQVMNLGRGKLYNVRAVVKADGFNAERTAFIGDIEAGSALSGSTEITAVGLSGNSLYGKTQGTVTFYYEDEAGKEMSEEKVFETTIVSPLSEKREEEIPDDTSQWWVIMAVIVGILFIAIGILAARRFWHVRSIEKDMEEKYEDS